MSKSGTSTRAKEVWKRLLSWYGARLGDQYGMLPPDDWATAVDEAPREVISKALDEIRVRYPVHPPTYPQFFQLINSLRHASSNRPTNAERLSEFITKNRAMTFNQCRQWAFHYVGDECVFVDVPDDDEVPGFRVRIEDLPKDDHA